MTYEELDRYWPVGEKISCWDAFLIDVRFGRGTIEGYDVEIGYLRQTGEGYAMVYASFRSEKLGYRRRIS